jgi:hypothetical protein
LAIKNAVVPSGDDPVVHALKVMEIVGQGTLLFSVDDLIYVAKNTVFYPSGYHSTLAFLNFFTNIAIPKLILLSYLFVWFYLPLAAYFLVKTLTDDRIAPIASALFITTSFFFTEIFAWGGYPPFWNFPFLLMAMGLYICYLKSDFDLKSEILNAMLVAGLFLIHPHAALVFIIFVSSYATIYITIHGKKGIKNIFKLFKPLLFGVLIYFVLAYESIIPLYYDAESFPIKLIEKGGTLDWWWDYLINRTYVLGKNYITLVFGLIGILSMIFKKSTFEKTILITFSLIILWSLNNLSIHIPIPVYSTVPTSRVIYNLAPFLPIFAGLGFGRMYGKVSNKKWRGIIMIILIVGVFPPLAKSYHYINVYSDFGVSVTDSDIDAFNWIKENTQNKSVFLNEYNVDAGQWIPIFTERSVLYTQAVARNSEIDYWTIITQFRENVDSPSALELLEQYNFTYVYIGDKTTYNRKQLFDATKFLNSEYYLPIYYKNGIWIFKTFLKFNNTLEKIEIRGLEKDYRPENSYIDVGSEGAWRFLRKGRYVNEQLDEKTAVWSKGENSVLLFYLIPIRD